MSAPEEGTTSDPPVAADDRPLDRTPRHTGDLPPTPMRDRNVPASAWIEAPPALRRLGRGLPDAPAGDDGSEPPEALYKRRIGRWALWRVGPARRGHARYLAVDVEDVGRSVGFTLHPDGSGEGTGPTGTRHQRFRTWKEDLRDHG